MTRPGSLFIQLIDNTDHLWISDVVFDDNGEDIATAVSVVLGAGEQVSNSLIERCSFFMPEDAGLNLSGDISLTIRNCVFPDMFRGVYLNDIDDMSPVLSIYNSTFLDSSSTGIWIAGGGDPTDLTVRNSIFDNDTGINDLSGEGTDPDVDYCVFNCSSDDITDDNGAGIGSNSLTATDPELTSVYRLKKGSPCVDAGDNSVVSAGDTDILGNPRIFGGTVDIGAVERGLRLPLSGHWHRRFILPYWLWQN
jgi:hypothetical protein